MYLPGGSVCAARSSISTGYGSAGVPLCVTVTSADPSMKEAKSPIQMPRPAECVMVTLLSLAIGTSDVVALPDSRISEAP